MKIRADEIKSVLSSINASGGSGIGSDVIFLYRNPETNALMFGLSDRSSSMRYTSGIIIPEDDPFRFDDIISFQIKVLTDIINSLGNVEIELSKTDNIITFKSPNEVYELTYSRAPDQILHMIFNTEIDTGTVTLLDKVKVQDLKQFGILISNLGGCKVDNKVRTIIHRKVNTITCVIITNTTLNTFQVGITDTEPATTDLGLDTKSPSIPSVFSNILKSLDSNKLITIKYSTKKVYIDTDVSNLCVTYETSKEATNIEASIKAYQNMQDIIDKANTSMLKILVPVTDIERELNKAALLLPKVIASRLDSHIPLEIISNSSLRIKFSTANGAYSNTIFNQVSIDGFIESKSNVYQTFNMNVPIMRGVLSTISKCYPKERVEILMKDTLDHKTYVQIKPEKNDSIKYYIRLRR